MSYIKSMLVCLVLLLVIFGCATKPLFPELDIKIAANPNLAEVYYERGEAIMKLASKRLEAKGPPKSGNYPESSLFRKAIKDFDKAILLNPNFSDAYGFRGLCNGMIMKFKKGCADLNKACELGSCGHLNSFHYVVKFQMGVDEACKNLDKLKR